MKNNLFFNYLRISLMLSLLPLFVGHAMEHDNDEIEAEQAQEVGLQTGDDFNFFKQLPPEILHDILMRLVPHDPAFEYLRRYVQFFHRLVTNELAELDIQRVDRLWKKLVLSADASQEFHQKTKDKYNTLEKNFLNYRVLSAAFHSKIASGKEAIKMGGALYCLTTIARHGREKYMDELDFSIQKHDENSKLLALSLKHTVKTGYGYVKKIEYHAEHHYTVFSCILMSILFYLAANSEFFPILRVISLGIVLISVKKYLLPFCLTEARRLDDMYANLTREWDFLLQHENRLLEEQH